MANTVELLAARLAGIEAAQAAGARLTDHDRGQLAAARRHGGVEMAARADSIERVDRVQRAKSKRGRQ